MKNKLLEILSSLSEKTIKLLTSDVILRRGYEYYFQRKMVSLAWGYGDQSLLAYVRGTATYKVQISYDDGDFRIICNCPAWHEDELCKHAACALLTISNVLHNQRPDQPQNNFLQVLLAEGSADTSIENNRPIVLRLVCQPSSLSSDDASFATEFFSDSKKLNDTDFRPGSLFARLAHGNFGSYNQEKLLITFFEEEHKNVSIEVETKHGVIPIVWDKAQHITSLIELNSNQENVVHVSCVAQQDDGIILDDLIRISQKLIVDIKGRRLLMVQEVKPWYWAEKTIENIRRSLEWFGGNATVLPEHHDFFNESDLLFTPISELVPIVSKDVNAFFPIVFEEELRSKFIRSIRFKKDGQVVVPEKITPTQLINGFVDADKKVMRLEPQCFFDQQQEAFFWQMFMEYVRGIDQWLKAWVRTKTRRSMIIKGLFELISAVDLKQEKLVVARVMKEVKNSYDGYTGASGLKEYFESFHKMLTEERLEQIAVGNQHFYEIHLAYKNLWRSGGLISCFFEDAILDEKSAYPCLIVPLDIFYEKFYLFSRLLEQQDIQLRLNRKRVETVKLKVNVDVSRGSGSSWFDLAPHIEAEGMPLSDEQREVLFAQDGTLESADCIKILDPQSREIINLLAKIFQQGNDSGTAKNSKHITQLPRLHILNILELRKSGATVTLAQEDEELIQRLTQIEKIEKIPLPIDFNGSLREYQKSGYYWFAFLYQNRFGACLADDMGLGKTIQVIAFLGGLKETIIKSHDTAGQPHLIVVPPTLVFNWEQELHKFYPALKIKIYTGKSADKTFSGYDIVLTTYDRVRLDIDYLKEITFHLLILDEAQSIKNIYAARTSAVRQLKSIFTICLTGTPLENHLGEYHSIIDVALPGLLPDYKHFMRAVQDDQYQELIRRTKPFVLRRTKDAILKELPSKVESNVVLTMTDKQQKVYATTVAEVKRLIDQAYETKTAAQAKVIALTAILRLRQICISPELIDAKKEYESPKVDHVLSSLDEIIQESGAALVFSQFTKCLDLLEKALQKAQLAYYRIDGKTSMAQRKKIVEDFQSGVNNVSILLLSLKTGGVGLNLTRANYVFHVDPWWNPSVENQASDRAHRIGQQKTVFVSRLVMHGSIEEKMMVLKEKKLKLFNEVVEQAEHKTKGLISKQDFDLLLS